MPLDAAGIHLHGAGVAEGVEGDLCAAIHDPETIWQAMKAGVGRVIDESSAP